MNEQMQYLGQPSLSQWNATQEELKRLRNQLVSEQWQPIETAPRDRSIFGWCEFPAGAEVRKMHWSSGAFYSYGWPQTPTHWMPVPAGPNCKLSDEQGSSKC